MYKRQAERAGIKAGDAIQSLAGQPLISIADVQWALHRAPPEGGTLKAEIQRGGKLVPVSLVLSDGWKRAGDITWRSSSWGLRRIAFGGMFPIPMTDSEREAAKAPATGLALKVKHVGQYGPHAVARDAGVKAGDILVAYDGRTDFENEGDIFWHVVSQKHVGDKVTYKFLRDGKPLEFTIPLQP